MSAGLLAGCESPITDVREEHVNNVTVTAEDGSTVIMNSQDVKDADATSDQERSRCTCTRRLSV